MPIYEYRCNQCRQRTSVFTRSISAAISARCVHCDSTDVSRLVSRVAVIRSGSEAPNGFDESSLAGIDDSDPRSVARWVRRMSREMGEPLDAGMEADLERMEAGEMADDYEDDGDGLGAGFGDVD